MILNDKYVFHIPKWKVEDDSLVPIDGFDELADSFFTGLSDAGYDFYVLEASGFYNGSSFPELLVVVFSNSNDVLGLFFDFFAKNSEALAQEALAWEVNGSLSVMAMDVFLRDRNTG